MLGYLSVAAVKWFVCLVVKRSIRNLVVHGKLTVVREKEREPESEERKSEYEEASQRADDRAKTGARRASARLW